ncbi:MAG: hypothetical protein P8Z73_08415 [Desulfobacteraceae bacterium]
MKNWKATVPIFLSLVIAVGGSYFIYQWIQRKTAPKEIVRVEKTDAIPVTVAAMDLSWGTQIRYLRVYQSGQSGGCTGHHQGPCQ